MVTVSAFVFIYVLGGLTFVPLLLAAILCHAYLTFPAWDSQVSTDASSKGATQGHAASDDTFKSELDSLPDELKPRSHEPDVAAGYFAVCREYVPGGVNGKPPERTTPAGAVVVAESPSVYQSMYRSIFDRNKTQTPTLDGGNGKAKKARNVFFVVLRHGHLMLYDDVEQLEVRHVIALAHYDVDIYAGGENIPEGELWIKRNCIRLTRKRLFGDIGSSDPKPFFIFSENCFEKEDFYHALLQNQEHQPGSPGSPPTPLHFETAHLVKLVQQLHASEENLQTRWINALVGRLFLGLYKTSDVEDFIRMKITKKIARVPKPAFINSIKLQKIDMGDCAPFITNPKLKELTVDGDITIEADVKYKGNFRLEIAAVARIELRHFKAREVNLILAGILKKLGGHILIRIKPPPSNRLWISFETVPKMDMSIEPIVSSRQITYGVILRAIESRIREVLAETLVLPNWDDIPFHDTMLQRFRGGIWADDVKVRPIPDRQTEAAEHGLVDQVDKDSESDESEPLPAPNLSTKDKTMSMPSLVDTSPTGLTPRKAAKSTISLDGNGERVATSSGAEVRPSSKPKAIRSGSFASAATPIVNMDPATVEALRIQARKGHQDAASAMKVISSRSQPTSPAESPVGSPSQPSLIARAVKKDSFSSMASSQASKEDSQTHPDSASSIFLPSSSPSRQSTMASLASNPDTASTTSSTQTKPKHTPSISAAKNALASSEKRQSITAAAKMWFANRQHGLSSASPSQSPFPVHQSSVFSTSKDNLAPTTATASTSQPSLLDQSPPQDTETLASLGSPAHPIGRGQPLPPPGTPLPLPPKPEKRITSWSTAGASALASLAKRKPVPPPGQATATISSTQTPVHPASPSPPKEPLAHQENKLVETPQPPQRKLSSTHSIPLPPLPPRRKRLSNAETGAQGLGADESLLVVEAPVADISAPPSPMEERNFEEQTKNGSNEGDEEHIDDEIEQGDPGVFQAMDMDDYDDRFGTNEVESDIRMGAAHEIDDRKHGISKQADSAHGYKEQKSDSAQYDKELYERSRRELVDDKISDRDSLKMLEELAGR